MTTLELANIQKNNQEALLTRVLFTGRQAGWKLKGKAKGL